MKKVNLVSQVILGFSIFPFCLLFGWLGYATISTQRSVCHTILEPQFVGHALYFSDSLANNSLPLYQYLVEEKGYKIIECDVLFTKDDFPILSHEENVIDIAVTEFGSKADYFISATTYEELASLDFSKHISDDSNHVPLRITSVENLLRYLKKHSVCVQFDMQKYVFSYRQYSILYDIVAKYGMLDKVIWEVNDSNFWTLALKDPNLIYQLDYSWDKDIIDRHKKKLYFANKIFVSLLLNDKDYQSLDNYHEIIDYTLSCPEKP